MVRRHWLLLLILAAALVLRVAVAVAYRPALLWSDTWSYVTAAYTEFPVRSPIDRPTGYPLFLRIVGIPGHSAAVISTVQHLAGLVGGVLIYALLRARGVRLTLAAGAAAVVLLDSYSVALEQHILTEAPFTAALIGFAFLATRPRPTLVTVAAAGLMLVAAVTFRSVALFVIPIWLLYSLWSYPDRRRRITAAVSIAAPLLCYVVLHQAAVGASGFTRIGGYLLYARVGQIADCRGLELRRDLRELCPRDQIDEYIVRAAFGGDYEYFYLRRAAEVAGDPGGYGDAVGDDLTPAELSVANRRLQEFALTVIAARPLEFAGLVASTTLRFLQPGEMSPVPDFDRPILFPASVRRLGPEHEPLLEQFLPGYSAHVDAPSAVLRDYQRWIHTPRWLLAAIILVAFGQMAALALKDARRQLAHRREVFLLVGGGVALLVGAAINRFEPRYMIPAVPLIVTGGAFALEDLTRVVLARWRQPPLPKAAAGPVT